MANKPLFTITHDMLDAGVDMYLDLMEEAESGDLPEMTERIFEAYMIAQIYCAMESARKGLDPDDGEVRLVKVEGMPPGATLH